MMKMDVRGRAVALLCLCTVFGFLWTTPSQAWTYYEDFIDDAGQADPGGWVSTNFNAADTPGPYFETQSYDGRTVLWCGRSDPSYAGGSGYGNGWVMWVEKEFTQPPIDGGGGNPGRIAFDIQYDVEEDWDWIYVQVSYDDGLNWDTMAGFTGVSAGFEHHELNWEAWTVSPPIRIRFLFLSDGAWSDEDGGFDSDGAFRLDNVQLIDIRDGSESDRSDFDTGFDGWIAGKPTPPGPEYALQPVAYWSDYAPRPDGGGYAWTAIPEANGVFPAQIAGEDPWDVGIESPRLEIPADADEYSLKFDLYLRLPLGEELFYYFDVASPAPEDGGVWRGGNMLFYGNDLTWLTRVERIEPYLTPGATSLRLRLHAMYYPWFGLGSTGIFTGPGPVFGAVTVEAREAVEDGTLAGRVYQAEGGDCPAPGEGLYGVTLNLFDSSGGAVATLVTDTDGGFSMAELPAGSYLLSLVRPLGYHTSSDDRSIAIIGGETTQADIALECIAASGDVRTIGFWKHTVNQALGGGGLGSGRGVHRDEPLPDDIESPVCDLLDTVVEHFNDNAVNQVLVFQPPDDAMCTDKLELALSLLNLQGSQAMISRARQQLMALLLNAADGRLALTASVSEDGATLSQAITYCDNLIDLEDGDHETAKTIADLINNGETVPAGMIPLDVLDIAYSQGVVEPASAHLLQNRPNPFNPSTTIAFTLDAASAYRLSVVDIAGRVARVFNAQGHAGTNQVVWDGRDAEGRKLGSGVYLYTLEAPGVLETRKMTLLK